jgi:hypothetical protein
VIVTVLSHFPSASIRRKAVGLEDLLTLLQRESPCLRGLPRKCCNHMLSLLLRRRHCCKQQQQPARAWRPARSGGATDRKPTNASTSSQVLACQNARMWEQFACATPISSVETHFCLHLGGAWLKCGSENHPGYSIPNRQAF